MKSALKITINIPSSRTGYSIEEGGDRTFEHTEKSQSDTVLLLKIAASLIKYLEKP